MIYKKSISSSLFK